MQQRAMSGLVAEAKSRVSITSTRPPGWDYAIVTVSPYHGYPTTLQSDSLDGLTCTYLSYRRVERPKHDVQADFLVWVVWNRSTLRVVLH